MKNQELFEKRITRFTNGKDKYLLREGFQVRAFNYTRKICKELLRNKRVKKIWIGGSIIKNQLGKYVNKWNERDYSDIDLFILIDENRSLREISLIRKIYHNKEKRYFRVSVMDSNKNPLKIFEIFSVDVWLFTPKSFINDLKKFPNLLDKTVEVK